MQPAAYDPRPLQRLVVVSVLAGEPAAIADQVGKNIDKADGPGKHINRPADLSVELAIIGHVAKVARQADLERREKQRAHDEHPDDRLADSIALVQFTRCDLVQHRQEEAQHELQNQGQVNSAVERPRLRDQLVFHVLVGAETPGSVEVVLEVALDGPLDEPARANAAEIVQVKPKENQVLKPLIVDLPRLAHVAVTHILHYAECYAHAEAK